MAGENNDTRVGQRWIHDVQHGHVMIRDAEMFAATLLIQEECYQRGQQAERRKWKVIRATNWVLWAALIAALLFAAWRS